MGLSIVVPQWAYEILSKEAEKIEVDDHISRRVLYANALGVQKEPPTGRVLRTYAAGIRVW